jgi:oligoribonuclease NrnB/cAMP/cGMP phosphodiesterase (DHH superfamily)
MICIYHSRDLDGYCSGAIVKKKYPEAVLIGYDYGQPFPWESITGLEPVIMVDVSLPMEDMAKLVAKSNFMFTWIDHHASSISDFNKYFNGGIASPNAILKDGIAACEIAWRHFFPDKLMPRAVELLGQYDTWRQSDMAYWDKFIIPFQYGMRLHTTSPETFPLDLLDTTKPYQEIADVIKAGEIVLTYQKQQNAKSMASAFEIEFMGHRAIVSNESDSAFNSLTFESVYDPDKHDLMMPFRYTGQFWKFSLYTTKDDIDCGAIAKLLGGGGHRKAAGFQMEQLPAVIANGNDLPDLYQKR